MIKNKKQKILAGVDSVYFLSMQDAVLHLAVFANIRRYSRNLTYRVEAIQVEFKLEGLEDLGWCK